MKKSFFQKSYNLNMKLLEFLGLCLFLSEICFFLPFGFSTKIFNQETIENIHEHSKKIMLLLLLLALLIFIILCILCSIEIIHRLLTDNFSNYIKSIQQTRKLRKFLIRKEDFTTLNSQLLNSSYNTIIRDFNKSAGQCTVDITKLQVVVFLKYPRTQQAQKLFREMEAHLKEEISNNNVAYYFSAPTRIGNQLWFKGTKR